jgi:hypothetical protein
MQKPQSNTVIQNSLPIGIVYEALFSLIDDNIEGLPAFLHETEVDNKSINLIKKEKFEQEDDITIPISRFFNFLDNTDFYFENQYKTPETNATTDIGIISKKYSKHRTICFVEAKRLPTPKAPGREQTEYVYYASSKLGGIERFKTEKHAGKEKLPFSIMLGYIQENTSQHWHSEVNQWIENQISVSSNIEIIWANQDKLIQDTTFQKVKIAKYNSTHSRKTLSDLKLIHYWIDFA